MKSFIYVVCLVVISILNSLKLHTQYVEVETLWERSISNANRPAWFGENTERGMAYGVVDVVHRVYIASRGAGNFIRIINADTGEDDGQLDMMGISGGLFVINDVDVSSDGVVFACNMTLSAVTDPFKVYKWTSELIEPKIVISYNEGGYRLGDKFTVVGSTEDNSLTIYAAASRSNKVLRYTTNDNAESFQAEEITLSDLIDSGIHPSVGPTTYGEASFYFNASGEEWESGIMPRFYEADGSHVATFPGEQFINTNSIRYLRTDWGDEYVFTFRDNVDEQYAVIFYIPTDPSAADSMAATNSLGNVFNTFESGDVAIRDNDDGTYTLYVLAANNGIGAYRLSFIVNTVRRIEQEGMIENFHLFQNYPNPFNPVTTIHFEVGEQNYVDVRVYDLLGREVKVLVNEVLSPGRYSVKFDGSNMPSGIYIYRLASGEYIETRRMTLVK